VLSVLGITEQAIQLTGIDESNNNTGTCQRDTAEAEAAYCVRVQRCQMTVQYADHPASVHTDTENSREMECEVAGSDLPYH